MVVSVHIYSPFNNFSHISNTIIVHYIPQFWCSPQYLGAPAALDESWVKDVFVPTVQKVPLETCLSYNKSHFEPQLQRGAAVIAARKLSSAMSAAKAASDHMKSWFGWVTWLSWKSRGFENRAIFSGAPQRMTGWAWVSSVTAATAQLRESCSGLTVSLISLNNYFFQLPSDRCEWKVVNCPGLINIS